MAIQPEAPVQYLKFRPGRWEIAEGRIVRETPVTLCVNGDAWLTLLCTPSDLEALAVGFLYNEGLIADVDEIANLSQCASGEIVDVWLTHALRRPTLWKRTSGCSGGLTAVEGRPPLVTIAEGETISPEKVFALAEMLLAAQELYRMTGGVHTSILSDGENLLARAEDIGRHNTLDKIAGRCLLDRIQAKPAILVTTGRISSDMLQKAARMKASILISRTSPNALSVQMAQELGMTLVGYARRDQFRVYTWADRIEGAPIGAAKISCCI